jgi:hypothetical protein
MSNDISLSSSCSTIATRGFEGIPMSSAMTKFSPSSTKTKRVAETMWYLCSKGVKIFYLTNYGKRNVRE